MSPLPDAGARGAEREARMRALGAGLAVDVQAYQAAGLDPTTPVLGWGPKEARLVVIGRDPGREELVHRTGFIGIGGRKVRGAMHEALFGRPAVTIEDHLRAGAHAVWVNTVPYKPVGNKAWPESVRRAFRPWVADALVHDSLGTELLALGREAALWCGRDAAERRALDVWWRSDALDGAPRSVVIAAPDGAERAVTLYALPPPSPLNAAWASRFPGMMRAFLGRIGWGAGSWRVAGGGA